MFHWHYSPGGEFWGNQGALSDPDTSWEVPLWVFEEPKNRPAQKGLQKMGAIDSSW